MVEDRQSAAHIAWIHDPEPVTPFSIVGETGLLRLRYYAPDSPAYGAPPVLLVYPMIKRPYILDLLPERSVVQNFLRQGFKVYLTDWLPPNSSDSHHGLDEYVNHDLDHAVDTICQREGVQAVALVGCCCGGLLGAIHAALHPDKVQSLVTFAAPFASKPPMPGYVADQIVATYGNVPAWMIGFVMNSRMRNAQQTAALLARDLVEPELAAQPGDEQPPLLKAFRPWLFSDIPIAGRLFREVVRLVMPSSHLLESRIRVGGKKVDLAKIVCPVLTIAGEHDVLVPPASALPFTDRVGSSDASNLIFPTGHLGLMLSSSAHRKLWPEVGAWLRSRSFHELRESA